MKNFSGFVLVSAIIFCMSTFSLASEPNKRVISNNDSIYKYFGLYTPDTRIAGLNGWSDWNTPLLDEFGSWKEVKEERHPAWCDYSDSMYLANAEWIVPEGGVYYNEDFSEPNSSDTNGFYGYRKIFNLPATAYNIFGNVGIGADNYGWLYINGEQVLSPNPDANERNFDCNSESVGNIPGNVNYVCQNVIAAEVQNGINGTGHSGTHGPTGVAFEAAFYYEMPVVVWQPPVTNQEEFTLSDGTTLPLKFKLFKQDDTLMTEKQNVYMQINYGILLSGEKVDKWSIGEGVEYLRFDKEENYYIANFQTKNYQLVDEGTYTAYVLDGCTGEVLGSIDFVMDTSTGKGRGRGKN